MFYKYFNADLFSKMQKLDLTSTKIVPISVALAIESFRLEEGSVICMGLTLKSG